MKHEIVSRDAYRKYPWKEMREVGDYFDVPPGTMGGIRNSAYQQTMSTGKHFRTFKLEDGTVRVMLTEIELGAIL